MLPNSFYGGKAENVEINQEFREGMENFRCNPIASIGEAEYSNTGYRLEARTYRGRRQNKG